VQCERERCAGVGARHAVARLTPRIARLVGSPRGVQLAALDDTPRQAFVTFFAVTPAAFAAQALVHSDLAVKSAPDPEDVRWDSLGERNTAFRAFMRKTASRVLFGVGACLRAGGRLNARARVDVRASTLTCVCVCVDTVVLFWGALTSFVGATTSTEALAQQFPR